jgi:hypothetical protein
MLRVQVSVDTDADPEEVSDSALQLREELLDLDGAAVDLPAAQPPPAGARGGPAAAGELIMTSSNSAVLVALAGALRSWVRRDRRRKVTVRIGEDCIEMSNASERGQEQLVAAWLERHGR